MEETFTTPGTRASEKAPWESYSASFEEKLSPQLEAEIAEYAKHRHETTSSQNKEELARWKEENDELSKQYQFIHPSEYADEGPRVGTIMHSSTFINKLRKDCGLECWYRQHPQPRKITLVVKQIGQEPEVGCWVQEGFMPEYSMMRFDDHGVPLDEKMRGWRTCTLQLILKGMLDEETVTKVFGRASGPASERYNSTLYEWRNRKLAVK